MLDSLAEALTSRELLLVLDNVEHLAAAAASFVDLLARAPRLTLLVTSRVVLHVSGEHVFPVDPLADSAAVDLFEQRARSLRSDFRVTPENGGAVKEICRRVDRLPLAIELAAARVRTLRPDALLERLGQRLTVLTGGPRDLPARQQTLRATLEWSVRLLSDEERDVLSRLAVFPAGATLEAGESVCGADLDTLAALVDHNLVRRLDVADETRFTLPETIREYADEVLGDDRFELEVAVAEYLAQLVERAVLRGPGSEVWLPRIDAELDNLRAAFATARTIADPELELRLVGGLWRYWWNRGLLTEGRSRIEAALARADGPATAARALALAGAAGLAYSQGDNAAAKQLAALAVPCAQACGSLFDESSALIVLAVTANAEGDRDAARAHLERSKDIKRVLGLEPLVEMINLGLVALDSGEYHAAIELYDEVAAVHRRDANTEGIGFASLNLGLARYRIGEFGLARADFEEARAAFEQIGFRAQVANALLGLSALDSAEKQFDVAAERLGRASMELGEIGWGEAFAPELASEVEAEARNALGDEGFERAFAAGRL
jgi:predicted ATPase